MRDRLLIIIVLLVIGILYFVDYKSDKVNIEESDLLKTICERGYIIVGVKADTRPFGFVENGQNKGFDIDLAKHIAKDILHDENKIKFVPVTPANRLYKLNSNEIDMIVATMTITPERQNIIDFSKSYYVAREAILVKSGSNITSLSSLDGKNVGVLYGSIAEKNIHFLMPNAKVLGYKTYTEAYAALKSGRVVAVMSGDTLLRHYTLIDPTVKILPKKYAKDYYGVGVRKNKASKGLLNIINVNITTMTNDGSLIQLRRKWKLD